MKKIIKATIVTLTLGLTALYAGGNHAGHSHSHDGHDHSAHGHSHSAKEKVSKSAVTKVAKQEVKKLAFNKRINNSWSSKPVFEIKKSKLNYKNDWVVSFKNEKIKNKDKQTLYIFVSATGQVVGANYTGK